MLHLKVCILQTCNRKEHNVSKCVFLFPGKICNRKWSINEKCECVYLGTFTTC